MRISLVVDKILRLCAIGTALIAAPFVLMMGAFATDSGTPLALLIGLAFSGVGVLLLLWIILLSFRFRKASPPPGGGQSWYLTALVYTFGAGGIAGAAMQYLYSFRTSARFQEVTTTHMNYPTPNPQANWVLRIEGTLPAGAPVDHVEAGYATDVIHLDPTASGRCRTDRSHGEFPLLHTETIDLARSGARYEVSVVVDKFQPGLCGWHLREISFATRRGGSEAIPAWIYPYDPRYSIDSPPAEAPGQLKMDLWCQRHAWYHPGQPLCSAPANSPELAQLVPADERNETYKIVASRGTGPVEVDFHDLDAMRAMAPH